MPFTLGSKMRRGSGSLRDVISSRRTKSSPSHIPEVLDLDDVVVAPDIEELYHITTQLGVGQTAVVYEGVSRRDGAHYALKVFRNDGLRADPGAVTALRDEVKMLRSLTEHPYVVSLYEVVSTPAAAYLVMELVSGGDLLGPIERHGPYSERQACRLFAQIVEAVQHLHSAGVVHRDLKPENICFTGTDERQIKLIDLGAGGFLTPTGLGDLCGTPLCAPRNSSTRNSAARNSAQFSDSPTHLSTGTRRQRCARGTLCARRPTRRAAPSTAARSTTGAWASHCT